MQFRLQIVWNRWVYFPILFAGAGRISSCVMLSDDDESDDKGFQEEDMDCTAEMDRRSGSTAESDDNPRLKAEEQLSIDIERTFREIACKSTVGSILCDKQR